MPIELYHQIYLLLYISLHKTNNLCYKTSGKLQIMSFLYYDEIESMR